MILQQEKDSILEACTLLKLQGFNPIIIGSRNGTMCDISYLEPMWNVVSYVDFYSKGAAGRAIFAASTLDEAMCYLDHIFCCYEHIDSFLKQTPGITESKLPEIYSYCEGRLNSKLLLS